MVRTVSGAQAVVVSVARIQSPGRERPCTTVAAQQALMAFSDILVTDLERFLALKAMCQPTGRLLQPRSSGARLLAHRVLRPHLLSCMHVDSSH
jgi:hypothetical protein